MTKLKRTTYRNGTILLLLSLLTFQQTFAQDAQSSQIYSMPMHLNPALTGNEEFSSGYFNYRIQYPEATHPYYSMRFAADYAFAKKPMGVGVIMSHDRSGPGNLSRTWIGGLYSYRMKINKEWRLRTGVNASAVFQSSNFDNYIFGDQISDNGNFIGASQENLSGKETIIYPDVHLGAYAHNGAAWFGLTVEHITQPNQSFMDGDSRLPRKYSVQAGYKFGFINANGRVLKQLKEFSITPMLLYWMQSSFRRLELGAHFVYEPIMLGFWYRGIPIGKNEFGYLNQDALVFLFGVYTRDIQFGYSYDYLISPLGQAPGGAHEITLKINFGFYRMGLRSNYNKRIPNPRL